ncbi:NAD(P)-binding domain-containing protein [Sphingosinicella sp. LHD-64]|uniref:NADPH-dependent F420 reductase n=1 Tax=Sphingosinicella sp. LHD-64 TaxID=3072139 RepID=UPI00280CB4CC|nr:NAD(P)-binding domain-containing protein [Sphingosinicella sp. LHD-64]MDQ8756347.1 NAD(P)-binding domain-containing protein [Sphingosinicella sp. LHD-64]
MIGAGDVGKALGTGWARAGHEILFGVRDPVDPKHVAAAQAAGDARIAGVEAVADQSDVVVLAVGWEAVPDAIRQCGSLAGKIVIDATNPLTFGKDGPALALGFSTSGGEEVARLAPDAIVFKTMNQVGFAVMADASGYAARPAMFVAGDDGERKIDVLRLVENLGFEGIDAGPLRNARLLEPYAMLWIDQAFNHDAPRDNAFAFLRRE